MAARLTTKTEAQPGCPEHGHNCHPGAAKQAQLTNACDDADSPPSGHATITLLRAAAAVAKRRAVFAGRHACPHR